MTKPPYVTAAEVVVHLDRVYFTVMVLLTTIGAYCTARTIRLYFQVFNKLNPLVKAYMSVLFPHIVNCLNVGLRAFYLLVTHSDAGCKISSFFTYTGMLAQSAGAAFMAYLTYSMVNGAPKLPKFVLYGNIFIWCFMTRYTSIFVSPSFGPSKGIVCNFDPMNLTVMSLWPALGMASVFMGILVYYYWQGYKVIKKAEKSLEGGSKSRIKASAVMFWRGLLLVGTFYGCWTGMMITCMLLGAYYYVHPAWDVVSWWSVMTQPTIDSYIIYKVLRKVQAKDGKGHVDTAGSHHSGDAERASSAGLSHTTSKLSISTSKVTPAVPGRSSQVRPESNASVA